MTTPSLVMARLVEAAAARREPFADALRHHLLAHLVERVARTAGGDGFVLRGGMLMRAWLAPEPYRATRDLDYIADFPFDRDVVHARFAAALAPPHDPIAIETRDLVAQPIWEGTEFPGVRLTVALGVGAPDQRVSIDVGFHDPLVPAPATIAFGATRVRAVRPETQLAWKLHALAEIGASFRPKDLADLTMIVARVPLVDADLLPAIRAAFESRAFTLAQARATLAAPHFATKTARTYFAPYRARVGELADAIAAVRARLDPILEDAR